MKKVTELFVAPSATLHDVLVTSNATRRGIVLVVCEDERLVGVITDGDIRRAVLARCDLATTAQELLQQRRVESPPITTHADTPAPQLVALFRRTGVSQIPLVNDDGRVVGVIGLHELLTEQAPALQAVVMAGGRGTRLHPLTEDMPKPMLPVGDRPLMERTIRQLSDAGIRTVNVTTHYLADKITSHFGDGREFGVSLSYLSEDELLGTAGGLSLLPVSETPMLVINGDILTDLDFRAMAAFHREHGAMLTIAVRPYEVKIPYGVVEADGANVLRVVEKPTYTYFVNAGIYLLEPTAHQLIPRNKRFDMTELIASAIEAGHTVANFPVWEYWRDIGQHKDYAAAQADVQNGTLAP